MPFQLADGFAAENQKNEDANRHYHQNRAEKDDRRARRPETIVSDNGTELTLERDPGLGGQDRR